MKKCLCSRPLKMKKIFVKWTRHPLSISDGKKCLSSTSIKSEKKIMKHAQNRQVHIFNVWTISMQSLNIKEWILLKLQITQTRHHLSILDGKNVLVQHPSKMRKKLWNMHKYKVHIFNMWTIISQSLNKKEWKLLELQITQTWHP